MSINLGEAMQKRVIAVEWHNDKCKENVEALAKCLNDNGLDVVLFKEVAFEAKTDATVIDFPSDIDNMSKRKNYIFKYFREAGLDGFLHIIEDSVMIDKSPIEYIDAVENAMNALDYSIYFSTVTDPCNYLFKKFNPRLTIDIDDDEIKSRLKLPSKVSFTSHANTCWTIYDFKKLDKSPQEFDEHFGIAMYIIIEYLSRRRALRKDGQLYYMNQYLSISDEVGVYHAIDVLSDTIDQAKMQEEDALFKTMRVDYAPDNNIDIILDAFYKKIKEKTQNVNA